MRAVWALLVAVALCFAALPAAHAVSVKTSSASVLGRLTASSTAHCGCCSAPAACPPPSCPCQASSAVVAKQMVVITPATSNNATTTTTPTKAAAPAPAVKKATPAGLPAQKPKPAQTPKPAQKPKQPKQKSSGGSAKPDEAAQLAKMLHALGLASVPQSSAVGSLSDEPPSAEDESADERSLDVEAFKHNIKRYKARHEAAEERLDRARDRLEDVRENLSIERVAASTAKNKHAQSYEELGQARRATEAHTEAAIDAQREVAELTEELKRLQAAKDKVEKQSEAAMTDLSAEMKRLKSVHLTSKTVRDEIEGRLNDAQDLMQAKKDEIKRARDQTEAEMNAKVAEVERLHAEAQAKLAVERDAAEKHGQKMHAHIDEMNAARRKVENEVFELKRRTKLESDKLTRERDHFRNHHKLLTGEISKYKNKVQARLKMLDNARKQAEHAEQIMRDRFQNVTADGERVRSELAASRAKAQQEFAQLSHALKDLDTEKKKENAEHAALEKERTERYSGKVAKAEQLLRSKTEEAREAQKVKQVADAKEKREHNMEARAFGEKEAEVAAQKRHQKAVREALERAKAARGMALRADKNTDVFDKEKWDPDAPNQVVPVNNFPLDEEGHRWNYEEGGSDWGDQCAIGKQQSPIDIESKHAVVTDVAKLVAKQQKEAKAKGAAGDGAAAEKEANQAELSHIDWHYSADAVEGLLLVNTGKTLLVTMPPTAEDQQNQAENQADGAGDGDGGADVGEAEKKQEEAAATDVQRHMGYVEAGSFADDKRFRYYVRDIEFHSPSEHTIDGQRYGLEMQIRHQRAGHAGDDGLFVVSVLFDTRKASRKVAAKPFSSLLQKMGMSRPPMRRGDGHALPPFSLRKEIAKALNVRDFYRYEGSVTTPPCSQGVNWAVLREVQPVSFRQLAPFKNMVLVGDNGQGNNRRVQPVQDRRVLRVLDSAAEKDAEDEEEEGEAAKKA